MRQWQGYRNGINLGGWLSQCDICDRKHLDSFIQEADIRQIAKTGFDHVRIPIDYRLFETEDGNPKEDGFRYLDRLLEWCNSYGLHMLIDVRETYGYTYDPEKREVERMRFFLQRGNAAPVSEIVDARGREVRAVFRDSGL